MGVGMARSSGITWVADLLDSRHRRSFTKRKIQSREREESRGEVRSAIERDYRVSER